MTMITTTILNNMTVITTTILNNMTVITTTILNNMTVITTTILMVYSTIFNDQLFCSLFEQPISTPYGLTNVIT